jgi:hypothetical protein
MVSVLVSHINETKYLVPCGFFKKYILFMVVKSRIDYTPIQQLTSHESLVLFLFSLKNIYLDYGSTHK